MLITEKYKKLQIISHDDLDGYGAGCIMYNFAAAVLKFNPDDIIVTNTNYNNPFPVEPNVHFVIVTDISISNNTTMEKIMEFKENPNNTLIWIDHHQSTVDYLKNNNLIDDKKYQDILSNFIIFTNGCATLISWAILHHGINLLNNFGKIFNERVMCESWLIDNCFRYNKDIIKQFLIKYNEFLDNTDNDWFKIKDIPLGVRMIDDYDRWLHHNHESIFLNAAFYANSDYKDCKSAIFKTIILGNSAETMYEVTKDGKLVYYSEKLTFLNNLKNHGFIAAPSNDKYAKVDIICIEYPSGNSSLFGNGIIEKYKYKSIFRIKDGGNYSVSLYSLNDAEICAKEICEAFNGGGHPSAAGFVTNQFPFENIRKLPEDAIKIIDKEITALITIISSLTYKMG